VRFFELKQIVRLKGVETRQLAYQSCKQSSESSSLTVHPNVNYNNRTTKPHHYLNPKTPFQIENSWGQPNTVFPKRCEHTSYRSALRTSLSEAKDASSPKACVRSVFTLHHARGAIAGSESDASEAPSSDVDDQARSAGCNKCGPSMKTVQSRGSEYQKRYSHVKGQRRTEFDSFAA